MRALYDSKSKLDDRGIKYLLSEENKYKTWLKVEGALALSQAKEGFIPKEAAEEIASGRNGKDQGKGGTWFCSICESAGKSLQGRGKEIRSLWCDYPEYPADLPALHYQTGNRDL